MTPCTQRTLRGPHIEPFRTALARPLLDGEMARVRLHQVAELLVPVKAGIEVRPHLAEVAAHAAEEGPPLVVAGFLDGLADQLQRQRFVPAGFGCGCGGRLGLPGGLSGLFGKK